MDRQSYYREGRKHSRSCDPGRPCGRAFSLARISAPNVHPLRNGDRECQSSCGAKICLERTPAIKAFRRSEFTKSGAPQKYKRKLSLAGHQHDTGTETEASPEIQKPKACLLRQMFLEQDDSAVMRRMGVEEIAGRFVAFDGVAA
jgi:hypothetical protein